MSKHLRRASSGHLLRNTNGHLVNDCQLTPAPCLCPTSLANSYAMQPAGLTACAICSGGSCSTTQSWDGTFQYLSNCTWLALNSNYTTWTAGQCFNIDGANLSTAQIELNPYDCQWELTLNCYSSSSDNTLWQGVKTTGNSPAGIYTKILGCTGPNTLEVF
ncbi:hypothetical protein JYU15_02280 [bacterium AH-315-I18]|nr:hypothetical protein [Phycisphaeraceae bacterium]MBN4061243.1 hypothetical protein [bacterium AH-315-I18]